MPKINIPGLTSFTDGLGFGSSVIAPDLPAVADIHRINFYGSGYSTISNDGEVHFISSMTGLPAGITLGTNGLVAAGNPASNNILTPLSGIREPWDGTFFAFLTVSGDTEGNGTQDRGGLIISDKRLALDVRFRNNDPNFSADEPPWSLLQQGSGLITSGATNVAEAYNTNAFVGSNVIKINEPMLVALTKDVTANELRVEIYQDDFIGRSTQAVTFGTEDRSLAVNYGSLAAGMPGPNTLHAVGSWDTPLTTVQVVDMWQALQHTLASV